MNQSQIESFIWGVADFIRDTFKRGKYQDVILPLTVLRRLDCVLADKKQKVLAKAAREAGVKLAAPVKKAILSALSERNEDAEICRDKDGNPELRDTESVDIQAIEKDIVSMLREVAS